MTPHIEAKKEDIAKIVIMPGDPLRCRMIAEQYLTDIQLVNMVRNQYAYTGFYKGKKVTIFSSGMGNPSMGIYSYELFKFYDVEKIIRIGSCGAYLEDIQLYDIILVDNSYSLSSYLYELEEGLTRILASDNELNSNIIKTANRLGINFRYGNVFCTDTFYNNANIDYYIKNFDCIATEMETFALFSNAQSLGRKASAILTVSDNLITHQQTSIEERQNSFKTMIELALESIN